MSMENTLPQISMIVPVYNQEKYLEQCLESLVHQTYENIEIIVVDDGSTDGSAEICRRYASQYDSIKVCRQENAGVSAARMTGIAASGGQYIMFVDSDDWVEPDICEVLFDARGRRGADAAMCGYFREYPEGSLPKCVLENNTVLTGEEMERRLCGPVGAELGHPENMECFNTLCGRLYPASAVRGGRMVDLTEIGSSEDLLFNLLCAASIETTVYVSLPLYHYRKNVRGSSTNTYRPQLVGQWDRLYDYMEAHIQQRELPPACREGLRNRIALSTLGAGLNATGDDASFAVKLRRVREVLSDSRRRTALRQLKTHDMPLHWKVFYGCAKIGAALPVCLLLAVMHRIKGRVSHEGAVCFHHHSCV